MMTSNASELLRGLASGILPGGVDASKRNNTTPSGVSGSSFSQLFAALSEQGSGLPVTVAKNTDVKLTDEQMKRVARAADKAQAQGASRALVMIDGQALQLDVGVRQITGKVDMNAADVLSGIDAVVWAQASEGAAGAKEGSTLAQMHVGTTGLKDLNGWNPSLLRVLGAREDAQGSAASDGGASLMGAA